MSCMCPVISGWKKLFLFWFMLGRLVEGMSSSVLKVKVTLLHESEASRDLLPGVDTLKRSSCWRDINYSLI